MDSSRSSPRLAGWGRAAAVAVLLVAALNWIGWATGSSALTRLNRSWPHLLPWAALWLAALAVAVLLQSGQPPRARVWLGRGVGIAVGAGAAVVLVVGSGMPSLAGLD